MTTDNTQPKRDPRDPYGGKQVRYGDVTRSDNVVEELEEDQPFTSDKVNVRKGSPSTRSG